MNLFQAIELPASAFEVKYDGDTKHPVYISIAGKGRKTINANISAPLKSKNVNVDDLKNYTTHSTYKHNGKTIKLTVAQQKAIGMALLAKLLENSKDFYKYIQSVPKFVRKIVRNESIYYNNETLWSMAVAFIKGAPVAFYQILQENSGQTNRHWESVGEYSQFDGKDLYQYVREQSEKSDHYTCATLPNAEALGIV